MAWFLDGPGGLMIPWNHKEDQESAEDERDEEN